jgi:[acyl-carrier-protein] S-malonyltransferase
MLTAAWPATAPGWPKAAAQPDAVAGHSLGEYSALVAAGALTLADAVPLVRFRAQAMQAAVPVGAGAMVAVLGLEADAVSPGCDQATAEVGEVVSAPTSTNPSRPSSPAPRPPWRVPARC